MRRVTIALVVAAALLTVGTASALWSASTTGSGAARAKTLAKPTGLTATATSSSVSLSWTAPAAPSAPASSYIVRRVTPTAAVIACADATATSCVDSSVSPSTGYSYTVEAKAGTSWLSGQTDAAAVTTPAATTAEPTSFALVHAGTAGTDQAETGDRIEITFSQPLAPSSICAAWTAPGSQLLSNDDVKVTLKNGTGKNAVDSIEIDDGKTCGNPAGSFNPGTISFTTGGVVGSDVTFRGTTGGTRSTIAWDPAAKKLTVTLGTGVTTSVTSTGAEAVYTAASAMRTTANLGVSGTARRGPTFF